LIYPALFPKIPGGLGAGMGGVKNKSFTGSNTRRKGAGFIWLIKVKLNYVRLHYFYFWLSFRQFFERGHLSLGAKRVFFLWPLFLSGLPEKNQLV